MRLEGIAKGGFYPTPEIVVRQIAKHLDPSGYGYEPQEVKVLDPCCGDGVAAAGLAKMLEGQIRNARGSDSKCRTWGIELHAGRAAEARTRLDRVLHSDSFATDVARSAFDVLFLNPPYDYDDEARRLEHRFLQFWTSALKKDAVLALIVPRKRLATSAAFLATHYYAPAFWTFPEGERERFDQVALIARRKDTPYRSESEEGLIVEFAEGLEPESPDQYVSTRTPTSEVDEAVMFRRRRLNIDVAMREAYSIGWHGRTELEDLMRPSDSNGGRVRPLMPLRQGHLAMLIAAGFLDNMVLDGPDGERVLVRGVSRKRTEVVEEESRTREIEKLEMSVVTLDFSDWSITELRTS